MCACGTPVPAVPAQAVQAIPRESSVGRADTRVPAVHMYLRYRRRQCRQSRGKAPRDESYTKEHEKNSHRGNTVKKHSPRSCRSALQDESFSKGYEGKKIFIKRPWRLLDTRTRVYFYGSKKPSLIASYHHISFKKKITV